MAKKHPCMNVHQKAMGKEENGIDQNHPNPKPKPGAATNLCEKVAADVETNAPSTTTKLEHSLAQNHANEAEVIHQAEKPEEKDKGKEKPRLEAPPHQVRLPNPPADTIYRAVVKKR